MPVSLVAWQGEYCADVTPQQRRSVASINSARIAYSWKVLMIYP